jgi:hypothetical protein
MARLFLPLFSAASLLLSTTTTAAAVAAAAAVVVVVVVTRAGMGGGGRERGRGGVSGPAAAVAASPWVAGESASCRSSITVSTVTAAAAHRARCSTRLAPSSLWLTKGRRRDRSRASSPSSSSSSLEKDEEEEEEASLSSPPCGKWCCRWRQRRVATSPSAWCAASRTFLGVEYVWVLYFLRRHH